MEHDFAHALHALYTNDYHMYNRHLACIACETSHAQLDFLLCRLAALSNTEQCELGRRVASNSHAKLSSQVAAVVPGETTLISA